MLHGWCNMYKLDNSLIRDGLRELRRRLPPGWQLNETASSDDPADVLARLTAPNHASGLVALQARSRLDPKNVVALADTSRAKTGIPPLVVISRYLSDATRSQLRERGLCYLDLTGNVRIVVPEPGLFIETQGANEDPERQERPARSLKGPKASRLVRALVEIKTPPGVRELALLTKLDAGYVSRLLSFLDTEALVTRVGRGRLDTVNWSALLQRWAQEAPLQSRGAVTTYLEPRGLAAFVSRLAKSDERYAVTGSLAAAAFAPVTPARLAIVWIRDAKEAARRLGLRETDAGANVMFIDPSDDSVFDGSTEREGVSYVAPSELAADLLTSPGRGPTEGEELLRWMQSNEEAWRR
jgi:hypothetical protein